MPEPIVMPRATVASVDVSAAPVLKFIAA